ncbi:MAG: hypothetical protein KAG61_12015 [Bacteriovoracaceae bacterium]|nr:hypothetical protein [Bacteriovoracaceae bacterium]
MKKLMLLLLFLIFGLHAYGAVTANFDVKPISKKEPVMDGGSGGGPIPGSGGKPFKMPKD